MSTQVTANPSRSPLSAQLARVVASSLVISAACLVVFIAVRQLIGALTRPLPAALIIGVVLWSVIILGGARLAVEVTRVDRITAWLGVASTAILIALAVVLLPQTPLWLAVLVWSLIGLSEAIWWGIQREQLRWLPFDWPGLTHTPSAEPTVDHEATVEEVDETDEEEYGEELLSPGVTQQITRATLDAGREQLAGMLRVQFDARERSQVIHVAICPPFSATPHVTAQQLDGPAAQVRVTEAQAYGVRLELQLADVAPTLCEAILYFEATEAGCL